MPAPASTGAGFYIIFTMKKIFSLAALLLAASLSLAAQEPTTMWPYLFPDFQDGAILTRDGSVLSTYDNLFNLNLANGKVHYVSADTIMEADMKQVYTARIRDIVFINVGGRMYEVMSETDKGLVVKLTVVDFEQMQKTDIGYGVSSATASHSRTSLDLMGGNFAASEAINLSGKTYYNAKLEQGNGDPLPLRSELFLVVDGVRIEASKSAVTELASVDKAEAKAFFKANRIKWNKVESLQQVADFVYDQKHREQ